MDPKPPPPLSFLFYFLINFALYLSFSCCFWYLNGFQRPGMGEQWAAAVPCSGINGDPLPTKSNPSMPSREAMGTRSDQGLNPQSTSPRVGILGHWGGEKCLILKVKRSVWRETGEIFLITLSFCSELFSAPNEVAKGFKKTNTFCVLLILIICWFHP